ncbi:MAG: hypothetical protein RIT25_1940 [Planctomycetota bacterium]|jgi:HPt (histidine-containing phosphotransfer) domain-containing protein
MDQVLNMEIVEELISLSDEGNPELLLELIDIFLSDTPTKLQSIVQGAEAADFHAMERAAHSLKGSSGNLGAQRLQESCERMQYASRAQQLEISRSLAARIVREFEVAKAALIELRDQLRPA